METTDGSAMSSTSQQVRPKKGIKVHLFGDKKKSPTGVAASSLGDLIKKACARFQISSRGVRICLPDGTQVDSNGYFDSLENQALVFLLRDGQRFNQSPVVKLVESILATGGIQLREELIEVLRQRGITLPRREPEPRRDRDRTPPSRRDDDPDWFKGLETRSSTKEQFMRSRCESRVRTYFYKSRDQVRGSSAALLPTLEELMNVMFTQLKEDRFHGHYFDRTSDQDALCDRRGQFSCQGAFAEESCDYEEHLVNPYRSKEDRIMFSTWNLDHRIERSRTILPCLVKAAEEAGRRQVNWLYFYRLLFTTDNLRLVHIVCHDKASHDLFTCDQSQVFVR